MGQNNITITGKCSRYFIKKKFQKNHLPQTPQKKRRKKNYPGREDGGPSTRSKTAQENAN